jgi:hypothetical protein
LHGVVSTAAPGEIAEILGVGNSESLKWGEAAAVDRFPHT